MIYIQNIQPKSLKKKINEDINYGGNITVQKGDYDNKQTAWVVLSDIGHSTASKICKLLHLEYQPKSNKFWYTPKQSQRLSKSDVIKQFKQAAHKLGLYIDNNTETNKKVDLEEDSGVGGIAGMNASLGTNRRAIKPIGFKKLKKNQSKKS